MLEPRIGIMLVTLDGTEMDVEGNDAENGGTFLDRVRDGPAVVSSR